MGFPLNSCVTRMSNRQQCFNFEVLFGTVASVLL